MQFWNRVRVALGRRPKAPKTTPGVFGFYAIYLSSFFFTFQIIIPVYINSTFVSQIASQDLVGLYYTVGAIFALLLLVKLPPALRRFGNRRTVLFLMALDIFALLGLGTLEEPLLLSIAFVLYQALIPAIIFNLDLFLESFSRDADTGAIRGAYRTLINFAVFLGILLAGIVLAENAFNTVYLLAAVFVIPAMALVFFSLRTFQDPPYLDLSYTEALKGLREEKNIRNVLGVQLLMRAFYVWFNIYIPLYLITQMGFSFQEILLVILAVPMISYLLIQYPLGKLADKVHFERGMIMVGFSIASFTTAIISLIYSESLVVWAIIIFVAKFGVAIVEIMGPSYFYKQIDASHVNLISMFRTIRPIATIIAPLVATGLLTLVGMPMQYIFFVFGAILLLGIPLARSLEPAE